LITGGDPIRARFMHRDFFEFVPTFKLLVAGNHRPQLVGIGEAMRRRLHLIPFNITIPEERRDKSLAEKLEGELDGVLGWMLAGCADWHRLGLAPPQGVVHVADEYFADEDSHRSVDLGNLRPGHTASGIVPGIVCQLEDVVRSWWSRPWHAEKPGRSTTCQGPSAGAYVFGPVLGRDRGATWTHWKRAGVMNPLPPHLLSPMERRRALCKLLALGLVRLHARQSSELSGGTGESSLHSPPDRSGHATPKEEKAA
jgi:hypothetical protein